MINRDLIKTNDVKIIGTLTDVESNTNSTNDGREYISGNLTIRSNDSDYKMHFFAMRLTKSGSESKLYSTYATLDNLLNKRVEVTGELDEIKIVEGNTIKKANQLNAKFINVLSESFNKDDDATFEVTGFIKDGLAAVYEQDGATVKDYVLTLAQPNYKNTAAKILRFNVDKTNTNVVEALQNNFKPKDTITIRGSLNFSIETITKTEQSDFGPAIEKKYQRSNRRYVITSGGRVDMDFAYTEEEINELMLGTEAEDNKRLTSRGSSSAPTSNNNFAASASKVLAQPKLI